MLRACFHNDSTDKPHVHITNMRDDMDVRSPFYSKKELWDWIDENVTDIYMCNTKGLPDIL